MEKILEGKKQKEEGKCGTEGSKWERGCEFVKEEEEWRKSRIKIRTGRKGLY